MTLWGRLFCFNSGEILELKDHEYTVGRKNSCSITINDIATSSLHFKIHLQSGIPFITDSSRNGTIVNGKKIDSTPLLDFSEIKIQYDHYFVFLKPETKLPLLNDKFYLFESLLLGSGSFSNVYLAIDTITLERLACKAIKTKSLLLSSTKIDKEYERIKQEMSILKRIRHKNIISILDTSLSSDGMIVYLFLNRVNGGELFDRIVRDGAIPESETLFLFYQILLAIQYLHDHDICHRDIKAENLLLESPEPYSKIVLTDFGLCKSLESSVNMQTRCGTSTYLAPEILDNSNGYTKQVDCWSCGVLLYTMIQGSLPFGNDNDRDLFAKIRKAEYNIDVGNWKNASVESRQVLKGLLELDPEKRFSVQDVLNHKWIQKQLPVLERLYNKL